MSMKNREKSPRPLLWQDICLKKDLHAYATLTECYVPDIILE